MWQQLDCSASQASDENPSGCKADLFPWVEVSVGAGANGATIPLAALVDQFYAEVQAMGGGRQDTSSIVRRLGR